MLDLLPGAESLVLALIPTRLLDLPQSVETDQRPDKNFRQGSPGAPAAQGEESRYRAILLSCSSRCGGLGPYMERVQGPVQGSGRGVRLR